MSAMESDWDDEDLLTLDLAIERITEALEATDHADRGSRPTALRARLEELRTLRQKRTANGAENRR